jgi:hypothetical protein
MISMDCSYYIDSTPGAVSPHGVRYTHPMTAKEFLSKLEAALQTTEVGIELWFDADEYWRSKHGGQLFVDWAAEILDRSTHVI